MVMGIGDKIGNGNGKEWETTCMGMGMAIIPMGINSLSADTVLSLCNTEASEGEKQSHTACL